MPTGDLPGWRQVFADDFTGNAIDDRKWGLYEGQPAGDPGGWWEPSHVEVGDGVVKLRSYRDPRFGNRWVSGGMSSARALTQRYGKYEVRFRVDAGYGIAAALLLWPTADHWPPEIDFAEHGGENRVRRHMTATLHQGEDDRTIQRTVEADFTCWHTMGVEWTPGRLVYTLDGRPWATVDDPGVPDEAMELDAQTQAGTEGDIWNPAPDEGTPGEVDMEIDWAVAYAMAG
jgi:beta-glucanase (GH16 family)